MTSPWSVPVFTNLSIPTGAGPGDARIVIASQLPPPLDTYVPSVPFPTSTGYAGGVIFYSQGDDTTYIYCCVVEDAGPPEVAGVVFGYVVNGAMGERAAGDPMGVVWDAVTAFPNNIRLAGIADILEFIAATSSINISTDDGTISINAFTNGAGGVVNVHGEQSANITAENVQVRMQFPASVPVQNIIMDSTGITISTSAGDPITLDAGTSNVAISASSIDLSGDITWDGAVSVDDTQTGNLSTTSTSYALLGNVAVGVACEADFIAPASGKVWVHFGALIDNTAAAGAGSCSFEITEGSGTGGAVFRAASDADSLFNSTQAESSAGRSTLVTGLTAGDTYNAHLMQKSIAANTALFNRRTIGVQPTI